MTLIYDELHRRARSYLRSEDAGHTLQTTALVHEMYLRLNRGERAELKDRTHFFAVASQIMRHILVDHARTRHPLKRGGPAIRLVESINNFCMTDAVWSRRGTYGSMRTVVRRDCQSSMPFAGSVSALNVILISTLERPARFSRSAISSALALAMPGCSVSTLLSESSVAPR